jgi:hypothetical protein
MSAQPDQHQPVLVLSLAVALVGLAVIGIVMGLAWVLVS